MRPMQTTPIFRRSLINTGMNKQTIIILLFVMFNSMNSGAQERDIPGRIDRKDFDPATLLWYDAPAKDWEEALPVGNGRLGAMVFGKYGEERIQLNEETYWSGGPYSTVVKGGAEVLPDIQKYIFEGQPLKAHKLFGRYMMGYPVEQQKYQSIANLHLFFEGQDEVSAYKRWLDLNSGVSSVEYSVNGITYRREVISSAPDQVVLVRLTASKPGSISFRAQLRGCRNQAHSNYATDYFRMDGQGNDGLVVTGKSADYMGVEGKIRYRAQLKAIPEGGTIKVDDIDLTIQGADAVTLCFVAATNFVSYKDVSADQDARVENYLKGIEGKSFDTMREAAVKDYQGYFNRVSLKLESTENSFLPTDQRVARYVDEAESQAIRSPTYSGGSVNQAKDDVPGSSSELEPGQTDETLVKDPSMASLCYNFGRYLLISSSRPGTEPPNVQGIWNEKMNPKWDSKYCSNINTPMNYWAIESANLSELSEPLTTMVEELTDQGAQVAKEHYGARGWVFHQCTDLWRVAAPMDGPTWGTFTVGGAWLTTHLWEHYLYTLDTEYLRKVYPVIKGSVTFFMDFLIEHPNGKWLLTNPSNSPENPPQAPGYEYFFDEVTGFYYFTTICAGSSIDMQVLTDLFGYYIEVTEILDMDEEFANEVAMARQRLVPPQIGSDGAAMDGALANRRKTSTVICPTCTDYRCLCPWWFRAGYAMGK